MKTFILALPILALSLSAYADGPCKDKREAKHAARKSLHECVHSWSKVNKADDADPSSDCSSLLASFVQASKDIKACHAANQHKKK